MEVILKEVFIAPNKKRGKDRFLYGVGVSDYSGLTLNQDGTRCSIYLRWKALLRRCYSEYALKNKPNYQGVVVCNEWLSYKRFREWYADQVGFSLNYQLDKDLLKHGSGDLKIYSPETCVLLPKEINSFMIGTEGKMLELPIGVSFHNKNGKYRAQISKSGKRFSLGYFETPEEAFYAYKESKENYAKVLALKYKDTIDDRAFKALMSYTVNIGD